MSGRYQEGFVAGHARGMQDCNAEIERLVKVNEAQAEQLGYAYDENVRVWAELQALRKAHTELSTRCALQPGCPGVRPVLATPPENTPALPDSHSASEEANRWLEGYRDWQRKHTSTK